jgi:hypothetical protein
MKPRVVGLLGKAGSGKSTAGKYLAERYGAHRIGFANALKELAKLLWDFTDEQVYGDQEAKEAVDERWGISPRQAMQRLGDGARNTIHPLVWVDAVLAKIAREYRDDPTKELWVIEDLRYINEVVEISTSIQVWGQVIKLTCPDRKSTADPDHPSEAEVDKAPPHLIGHHVISKRSPESIDLKEKVDAAFQAVFPPEPDAGPFTTHRVQVE